MLDQTEDLSKKAIFNILNYSYLSQDEIYSNQRLCLGTPQNTFILTGMNSKHPIHNNNSLKNNSSTKEEKKSNVSFQQKLNQQKDTSNLFRQTNSSSNLKNNFLNIQAINNKNQKTIESKDPILIKNELEINPNSQQAKSTFFLPSVNKIKCKQHENKLNLLKKNKARLESTQHNTNKYKLNNLFLPNSFLPKRLPQNTVLSAVDYQEAFRNGRFLSESEENFKQKHKKVVEISNKINGEINKFVYLYPSIFLRRSIEKVKINRK